MHFVIFYNIAQYITQSNWNVSSFVLQIDDIIIKIPGCLLSGKKKVDTESEEWQCPKKII